MAKGVPDVFSGALGQRFDYVSHLGHGGMAEVYLARDRFHEREVALKIVRATPNAGEDRKQLDHLWLNEMRLAGRVKHPYILEIYEAGAEGGHSFLVMEYLALHRADHEVHDAVARRRDLARPRQRHAARTSNMATCATSVQRDIGVLRNPVVREGA